MASLVSCEIRIRNQDLEILKEVLSLDDLSDEFETITPCEGCPNATRLYTCEARDGYEDYQGELAERGVVAIFDVGGSGLDEFSPEHVVIHGGNVYSEMRTSDYQYYAVIDFETGLIDPNHVAGFQEWKRQYDHVERLLAEASPVEKLTRRRL